jgi:hypothetical protein
MLPVQWKPVMPWVKQIPDTFPPRPVADINSGTHCKEFLSKVLHMLISLPPPKKKTTIQAVGG